MTDRRVKLAGGPEKTVTWIWLETSQLKVEFYDFSETAQRMFGNDIAYTITVHEMTRLFALTNLNEVLLIQWLSENFGSYFGIKKWLEENEIGFNVERDSWA
jgi:retron-type reverse transcriptase